MTMFSADVLIDLVLILHIKFFIVVDETILRQKKKQFFF